MSVAKRVCPPTAKATLATLLDLTRFRKGKAAHRQRNRQVGVRFTPERGQIADISVCPLCANRALTRRSKKHRYSITSSARASNIGGTSSGSALAVLRLITSSNV